MKEFVKNPFGIVVLVALAAMVVESLAVKHPVGTQCTPVAQHVPDGGYVLVTLKPGERVMLTCEAQR